MVYHSCHFHFLTTYIPAYLLHESNEKHHMNDMTWLSWVTQMTWGNGVVVISLTGIYEDMCGERCSWRDKNGMEWYILSLMKFMAFICHACHSCYICHAIHVRWCIPFIHILIYIELKKRPQQHHVIDPVCVITYMPWKAGDVNDVMTS